MQFLRDQRGVSDSAEVSSVYYDNPGRAVGVLLNGLDSGKGREAGRGTCSYGWEGCTAPALRSIHAHAMVSQFCKPAGSPHPPCSHAALLPHPPAQGRRGLGGAPALVRGQGREYMVEKAAQGSASAVAVFAV